MSSNALMDAALNDQLLQETDCSVTYRVAAGSFDTVGGQRTGGSTDTIGGKCVFQTRRFLDGDAERETGDALIGQLEQVVELHAFDRLTIGTRTYLITELQPANGPASLCWLAKIEAVAS